MVQSIAVLLFLLLGFMIFIYSYYIEPNRIEIKNLTIDCNLKNKINFIHITDLHLREYNPEIPKRICKLNPDFIVITGDLIDDINNLEALELFLKDISKCGKVFVVYGNWEIQLGIQNELRKIFDKYEIVLLDNEKDDINGIEIVGLNPHNPNFSLISNKTDIVLVHFPAIAKQIAEKFNVCLILSGHTHGGQIRIPIIGPIIKVGHSSGLYYGLYRIKNSYIFVSKGLGTHKFLPIRLNCKPEMVLIELR